MVHERDDEYEGQEDGEYHFSDDQANYEMEPEITVKTAAPAQPKSALPPKPGGKSFKRPVIGILVFIFVIFLAFKIISPSSNAPATDITQNTTSTPTRSLVTHKPVEKTTVVTTTTTIPAKSAAPATPVQVPMPAAAPVTTVTTVSAPAFVPQTQTPAMTTMPTQQTVTTVQPSMNPAPVEAPSAQTSNAIDKLISLQDQNTKLVTQLQSESAQKIAEYEQQNNEMQGKIQDMTLRINALEATLQRLTKLLQDSKGDRGMSAPNSGTRAELTPDNAVPVVIARPPVSSGPRQIYTVQAIIPGRAWLKNDSGETVTVAEGDIIKNYGKIIKIDPYDGVVQIDTAGKIITLSYGAGSE
jgi:intracellular multiplication protein IcmG